MITISISKDNVCHCIPTFVNELMKYFKNLEATLKTIDCETFNFKYFLFGKLYLADEQVLLLVP